MTYCKQAKHNPFRLDRHEAAIITDGTEAW